MRSYLVVTVPMAILMALTLTAAPSHQAQCKNSCDVTYNFCIHRAVTKLGKSQCKANRSGCKKSCPASP
jgi:Tfp pilus assembly protein PilE